MYQTNQVYGVSNDMLETYIEREAVDTNFLEGLSKNKHIVIYGASKQGKTSLTNKHLKETDYIKVNCSPSSIVLDIYNSIVRQLDIDILETKDITNEINGEVKASIKAKVKIPLFGSGEVSGESSAGGATKDSLKYKTVDYNLGLAQDVSELLRNISFHKRVVLENFHYLTEEVQRQLAIDLRIFEDYNILFIVLGIWRESNRLIQYNGDLVDRIIEVPVEPWEKNDLMKIVEVGHPLLNVSFEDVKEGIVETCFDSVGVFQELCKEACYAAGVTHTSETEVLITQEHIQTGIEKKLNDYSSRHIRCLESFIEQTAKSSDEIPLYISYYFVKVLLQEKFIEVTKGLKRRTIQDKIKEIHHRADDVRSSEMGYFLKPIVANQIKKSISPPIFDYDVGTSTVKIIDSTFYFFLKNCDKDAVLDEIPIPPGV